MFEDIQGHDPDLAQGTRTGHFDCSHARQVVGAFTSPAFLINAKGKVLGHNGGGRELLNETLFVGKSGVLKFCDNVLDSRFAELRTRFFAGNTENVRKLMSRKLAIRLRRYPALEGCSVMSHAIVTLRARSHDWDLTPEAIEDALELPPMQARLVHAMLNGKDLDGFAVEARVSKDTARWHLRCVMSKFDCHSHTDLVRTLCILLSG